MQGCHIVVEFIEQRAVVTLNLLAQYLAALLVLLVQYVLGKFLYVLVNLPPLAGSHLVLDVLYNLGNLRRSGFKFFYVGIYGIVEQLLGIERNLHVAAKVQLLGKTAQNGLEECIDCLYTKVAIVMQNIIHSLTCPLSYLPVTVFRELRFDFRRVVGSTLQTMCNTIKLA